MWKLSEEVRAGTPAPDSRLLEAAHATGVLAVEMVDAERRPSTVLTRGSFLNAIVALAALGGSTNAVVHLLAIAGRLGVELIQDDFDHTGSEVPLLVDPQPAGRFLMDDLYRAGGLHAVLNEIRDLLDPAAITVTGRPLIDHLNDTVHATAGNGSTSTPSGRPTLAPTSTFSSAQAATVSRESH
ncbi:dihydroxy-acid dehydratase [Actinoplanes sp. ATCC 53533]|uniref:dihydroxy-acid dehydratase domain-containing protein n=1 Tax=Actinoplanes sp. ATCC 53533 TaxID=1288362 RepID=UPI001F37F8BB|nr:dihydroxy-acid dehydratase [Actinoplanes sp. ATCC 53533]